MSGRRRWTGEAMIEALRDVVAERGADVSRWEFFRASGVSESAMKWRFGSWTELRRAAGMPEREPKWTRRKIVARLRAMAAERGENVSQMEFCEAAGIAQATILRMCGGWIPLRAAAGLAARRRRPPRRYTRDSIRTALMRLAAEQGAHVTVAQFTAATGIAATTVNTYWGSWTALQNASGLKPNPTGRSRWSDLDLLREYQRVMLLLDKIPTTTEFDREGRCSMQTLIRRFGGWRELKRRCAKYLLAQALGTTERSLSADEMRRLMAAGRKRVR